MFWSSFENLYFHAKSPLTLRGVCCPRLRDFLSMVPVNKKVYNLLISTTSKKEITLEPCVLRQIQNIQVLISKMLCTGLVILHFLGVSFDAFFYVNFSKLIYNHTSFSMCILFGLHWIHCNIWPNNIFSVLWQYKTFLTQYGQSLRVYSLFQIYVFLNFQLDLAHQDLLELL